MYIPSTVFPMTIKCDAAEEIKKNSYSIKKNIGKYFRNIFHNRNKSLTFADLKKG